MRHRGCGPSLVSGLARKIRTMLNVCDKSLTGLADVFTQIVRERQAAARRCL